MKNTKIYQPKVEMKEKKITKKWKKKNWEREITLYGPRWAKRMLDLDWNQKGPIGAFIEGDWAQHEVIWGEYKSKNWAEEVKKLEISRRRLEIAKLCLGQWLVKATLTGSSKICRSFLMKPLNDPSKQCSNSLLPT